MNLYIFEIEAYLYSCQQIFQRLISTQYYINTYDSSIFLFLAGFLTSLNPCMFSIFPISIAYVSGQKKGKKHLWNFIFGLYSSILSGFSLTLIFDYKYNYLLMKAPLIASVLTIFLGLSLLNIFTVDFNMWSLKLNQFSHGQDYLFGFLLGFNSFSCSAPILLAVLFWQSQLNKIFNIFIYIFGYTLPIVSMLFLSRECFSLSKVMYVWKFFAPFFGSILLCFGMLKLFNNFSL